VDPATQLTTSGLHVIPTLMNRQDFKRILQLTVDALVGLIALDCLLPQALKKWDSRKNKLPI